MNILPEDNTWFKPYGMKVSNLDEVILSEVSNDDYIFISDMDGGKDKLPASKKIKVGTLLDYIRQNI